ncbi:MAG: hypothetical protein LBN97_07125 [Oscillospiraceae bacterium]|nr:hypothetical protein [Oscillospiraceae bacterium]
MKAERFTVISTALLFICGSLLSAFGIAFYAFDKFGVMTVEGIVRDGRLSFGYANAAALALAVCLFITITGYRKSGIRSIGIVLMSAALLLTFSVGSITVFTLGTLYWRKKRFALFAVLVLAVLAVSVVIVNYRLSIVDWFVRPISTALDRLMQYYDAARISVRQPFGIGPGRWKTEVYALQSSFYAANRMHSAPFAIAVECGIPAAFCAVLLAVQFLRKAPGGKWKIAAAMILTHSCFDITLTYVSIAALLAFCVVNCFGASYTAGSADKNITSGISKAQESESKARKRRVRPTAVVSVLLAALTVLFALSYFTAAEDSAPDYDELYLESREAFSGGNYGKARDLALEALSKAPHLPYIENWAYGFVQLLPVSDRAAYEEAIAAIQSKNGGNLFAEAAKQAKTRYLNSRQTSPQHP